MTSKEMLKSKLPEGHIFWNVSKLGRKPNWKIIPATEEAYGQHRKSKKG